MTSPRWGGVGDYNLDFPTKIGSPRATPALGGLREGPTQETAATLAVQSLSRVRLCDSMD